MSDCEDLRQLSAYHDGELPPEERRRLEAHLTRCEACARELRSLRRLSQALAEAPIPELSPEALERLGAVAEAVRERVVLKLTTRLAAVAASVLVACAVWLSAGGDVQRITYTRLEPWERAAVTLSDQPSTTEVQQVAQWVVDDLSLENGHD